MVAVVGLTYETMFSTLSTYGLSRTQHSHNIQQAAPSAMISSPTVRVEEIDGCSSNGGRARPADDFHGVHGPDPESCGRARSTREVAHLLRRRDVARDLLLRKLVGSTDRPSVGAVLSRLDENTRHGVASVSAKPLGQPLRHAGAVLHKRLRA